MHRRGDEVSGSRWGKRLRWWFGANQLGDHARQINSLDGGGDFLLERRWCALRVRLDQGLALQAILIELSAQLHPFSLCSRTCLFNGSRS